MLVFYGSYRWAPKLVAFRNDWCTQCQQQRLVFGRRTIDFGHFFWIPILPLGRWTRWYCVNCGSDPAQSAETRRPFRIIAWLFALLFFGSMGVTALDGDSYYEDTTRILMGVLGVLGIGYMTWWAFRSFGGKSFKERRAAVTAYAEPICPICDGHLAQSLENQSCSSCGAEHRPLKTQGDDIGPGNSVQQQPLYSEGDIRID